MSSSKAKTTSANNFQLGQRVGSGPSQYIQALPNASGLYATYATADEAIEEASRLMSTRAEVLILQAVSVVRKKPVPVEVQELAVCEKV